MEDLKLYVWEDVLHNYGPGLLVCLAHSLEEAHKVVKEKHGDNYAIREALGSNYKVITEPESFLAWGGG